MASMKLHRSAAFAIMAWYLMMPPIGGDKVYVRAPLSTWQIVVEAATLKDCRNILLNYKKHPYETTDPKVQEALKLRISKGICVSSKDSRLGE
jgi:hypothetical protein